MGITISRARRLAVGVTLCVALAWSHCAAALCHADCDGSGTVDVNELILCVGVSLGSQSLNSCQSCDSNGDGSVEMSELVASVNDSLNGCPPGGTPPPATATPTPTCPDYVPTACMEVSSPSDLPSEVSHCYKITKGGTYTFTNFINILGPKGALYIVEDPNAAIDIRVPSLLVEQGGVLQAGSASCPIGKMAAMMGTSGGKVSIGLWGDDPSKEATVDAPPMGITCKTSKSKNDPCFAAARDFLPGYYCTDATDDPCKSKTPAPNSELEHYESLNFDPSQWGYKVLGVSYGGVLNLFGYKGAKPLQDDAGKMIAGGEDVHCVVPTDEKEASLDSDDKESTLDTAEMKAWAKLTGSSWVRLQAVDGTKLTLDRAVKDWAPGDQIVVGTTDWYPSHSEVRTIRAVSTSGDNTQITVCRPTVPPGEGPGGCAKMEDVNNDKLEFPHFTQIFDAKALSGAEYTDKTLNRTAVDLRAVVGLLSRSIQIRSLGTAPGKPFPGVDDCVVNGDTAPDGSCYFGGHVMVRQGFKAVQIQGVEFKQLGQGGRMGHYPLHFHFTKSTAYTQQKAFVKDSSIWDSMNRFVVLHGSQGITLARNVGFLSMGHGYYLEDGSEIDNRLCHNLGISARASIKEFFKAQAAQPKRSLLARYVPPILDGVCGGPGLEDCNCQNPLTNADMTKCNKKDDVRLPQLRTGSDTFMPVMYWAMNAANEFVGNAAVGVHGFGSCYWLLGSGLSGMSVGKIPNTQRDHFAGLANYNDVKKGFQAPLRRFRGNSCSTSPLALSATAELPPASIGVGDKAYQTQGFTAVNNPYLMLPNGIDFKPPSKLKDKMGMLQYDRPAVVGNFQPIQPNTAGPMNSLFTNCAQTAVVDTEKDTLSLNPQSCVTTVIDRFSTSFNWAEVNFGSIWFRPWFYMFLNSAMTDQLFGGLTFVTAGSWVQVPPGYFSLAKNNLFVGTSQVGPDPSKFQFADRSGPIFEVNGSASSYQPCRSEPGKTTCNLDLEGVGIWSGNFQPKRMITIYDGPHFADGNLFLNIGAWKCDPQPCQGNGECKTQLKCGIYSSTMQPAVKKDNQVDPHQMIVIDAPIGWKQPNGFYYPPAFSYRRSTFFKTVPPALADWNQCYSFSSTDGYKEPLFPQPGSCRHNVIDRTRDYIKGNMENLTAPASVSGPSNPSLPLPIGPIDFTTILTDLDGSLTGATGAVQLDSCKACDMACTTADGHSGTCKCSGMNQSGTCQVTLPSTSLSRNAFFDAPAQTEECLSFGLQTSPYQFVTSVMAQLKQSPSTTERTFAETADPEHWPDRPGVAIYRQWKRAGEKDTAGQICDSGVAGSDRGMFMVGPNIFHAPALTQSEPPGLSEQPGATYYIDTGGGHPDLKEFKGSVEFTNNGMGRWSLKSPGIGKNLTEGQMITVKGASKEANNKTFTVAFVESNDEILVASAVVAETATVTVSWKVAKQSSLCFPKAILFGKGTFVGKKSYVLYHLFARNDAAVSYQLFVGDGLDGQAGLDAIKARWVRVNPHLHQAGSDFASLVFKPCTPGDTRDDAWCKDLPVPKVEKGILTVKLDDHFIAGDFSIDARPDYERCMPRDLCYYNATNKRCEACKGTNGSCIRQGDFLPVDIKSLSHKEQEGTGDNPLDVICQDWSTLASGTKGQGAKVGDISLVDCPKDGCLGFAFTLPDNFDDNQSYNDRGAKLTRCFNQSAWSKSSLMQRLDGMNQADPLCGAPRPAVDGDFCQDPGPPGTATATATQTATLAGPTQTNTPVGRPTPTNSATRAATATATATRSGAVTATATATALVTPTPTTPGTPTVSPTPSVSPTPPAGSLTWVVNGSQTGNINVPLNGMTYTNRTALVLKDPQSRFCTTSGTFPVPRVDFRPPNTVGVYDQSTTSTVSIANIPKAPKAGTYDLLVQTPSPCSGAPTMLRMPGAITYAAN